MINSLKKGKKIYFVSDAHLGLPPAADSRIREMLLVNWLEEKKRDAAAFYLMGDIFDYWFEYKKVVPRGFVRLLGKLAEITDGGIPVYFFTGNHDVWVFNYLPEEVGLNIIRKPVSHIINGKKFYLAHGDGLGPSEYSYKLLKKIFTSPVLQWLYARIHPNSATGFAHRWSKKSRFSKGNYTSWLGEEKEHLIIHSKSIEEKEHFDFYIYGHRHVPRETRINDDSIVIYLGDWFVNFTYAEFDGEEVSLRYYKKEIEGR
jgi:UDP-2,3-diacylglucosamine hydrolase